MFWCKLQAYLSFYQALTMPLSNKKAIKSKKVDYFLNLCYLIKQNIIYEKVFVQLLYKN
jgi:hypothetical protein